MSSLLPFDVVLIILSFLCPRVDYRTLYACSLVCKEWRLIVQASMFKDVVGTGEFSPQHFHRFIGRFEDNRRLGRYVRQLELVGRSKHVLGLVPLASFPTLAGSDVTRLIRQMPLLEELVVKGTIWVGDYVTTESHNRLRKLCIEQVQCMGPRSEPLALTALASKWQDLDLKDIRWREDRSLLPSVSTYAYSLNITLPQSIIDVAQFIDRLPSVLEVRTLTVDALVSYGSTIINCIADSCREELQEINLFFALEEEGE